MHIIFNGATVGTMLINVRGISTSSPSQKDERVHQAEPVMSARPSYSIPTLLERGGCICTTRMGFIWQYKQFKYAAAFYTVLIILYYYYYL
jgi:hypothetical protein